MEDDLPEAPWVELCQGPLDGLILEWQGSVGDRRTLKYSWDPVEFTDPQTHSTRHLGRDDADALQRNLTNTPKGWAMGWTEYCALHGMGKNPRGACTYQLQENSKALYEPQR